MYSRLKFTYKRFISFSYYVIWKELGEYTFKTKRRGVPDWTDYGGPSSFVKYVRTTAENVFHPFNRAP